MGEHRHLTSGLAWGILLIPVVFVGGGWLLSFIVWLLGGVQ